MEISVRQIKDIVAQLEVISLHDTILIDNNKYTAIQNVIGVLSYRIPMLITEYIRYESMSYTFSKEYNLYPVCPKCDIPTEKDYQKYCTCCGQNLKWNYSKMKMQPKVQT